MGGSAGATLALTVANRIVKDPSKRDNCKGCVALVPCVLHPDNVPEEYKADYNSYAENAKDVPMLDAESMKTFFNEAGVDPTSSDQFVALAKDNHQNFPPTYICACEADPLRDDAVIMARALSEAGVPVKSDVYAGLPHYFWIFPSVEERKTFFAKTIAGVQWVLAHM